MHCANVVREKKIDEADGPRVCSLNENGPLEANKGRGIPFRDPLGLDGIGYVDF